MTFRACTHERELAEAIRTGHWPAACAQDLRQHVATCRRCTDLARVKAALSTMRVRATAAARLEAPGLLLWRAQMRRRNAALERVARPIERASIFGLGVLLLVLVALAAFGLRSGAQSDAEALHTAWQEGSKLAIWAMVGAVTLLGGVVAYLAAERE